MLYYEDKIVLFPTHLSIKSERKSNGVQVDVSAFDIHFLDTRQVRVRASLSENGPVHGSVKGDRQKGNGEAIFGQARSVTS